MTTWHLPHTAVKFNTDDLLLARLYEQAEEKLKQNIKNFDGSSVLIEGAGYHKIWLETQPMGGEMYAKRDMASALNNQLMFMNHQRPDGRMPGSIQWAEGQLKAEFNKFQGFCFPAPALNMYYWMGKDPSYLDLLYDSLQRFDAYLWRCRDSNQDGLLESWCVTDTGEDGALRYQDAPFWWEDETPPTGYAVVPMASMDFMSYSYSARKTMADICRIKGNALSSHWDQQAASVSRTIRDNLWDDKRGACYDIDQAGQRMETLTHNNLRCMYWGSFSQEMADRFVKEHLLSEQGFWSPMPLCSVALSDPLFRNYPENNWSGQPEGLSYQRAIHALSQYGYQHLLPTLAQKLFEAIGMEALFCQQFDTFSGKPSSRQDGYSPTMLAVLEYITRLHGVTVQGDTLLWGALGGIKCSYSQLWGDRLYEIESDGLEVTAYMNKKRLWKHKSGQMLVSDYEGKVIRRIALR